MKNKLKQDGIMAKGYGIIPKLVMKDDELDPEAKAIYAYICSYAGSGKTAFPGVKLMCQDLSMSERRFYKYRKQLVNAGYIKIHKNRKNGKRANNIYELIHQPNQHLQNESVENESVENESTIINNSISNSSNSNSNNKLVDKSTLPTLSNLPRKQNNRRDYPGCFEEVWSAYPSRSRPNKAGAYKKYRARRKEDISHEDLLAAATNYHKECKKQDKLGGQYVKAAKTFFGPQDHWLDYTDKEFDDSQQEENGGKFSRFEVVN